MSDELVIAKNYIGGKFVEGGQLLDSINPATGKVWARIPDSDSATVDAAVAAAKKAFPSWSKLGIEQRGSYLKKVADLLEQRLEEFAKFESMDQGKPVKLARNMDIPRAILNLRYFASGHQHLLETSNDQAELGIINYTIRTPLGVAGLIAPWNLPLYLLTFKIAPALITGNTVVCKPSEMTSVTAWMLCQVFHEAGIPDGVLNLVCGYGHKAGEALVNHPDVKIISFTGSTLIGKRIASLAGPMMKRLSLELGGKNAAVVFSDARLNKAIPTLVRASFLNQGEICLCTSRIFVQESIFEEFLEKFLLETSKLTLGDPKDENTFMGALISKQHLEKVQSYLGFAVEDGGQVHGRYVKDFKLADPGLSEGFFLPPTVLTGLADDSRCMKEEIFGPVVCITKFCEENEVLDRVNSVDYGLCASVWSENVGVIHRMARGLQVGTVWENCWLVRSLDMPFGGCKQSGTGREGIHHSLEAYTDLKTVCIKIDHNV